MSGLSATTITQRGKLDGSSNKSGRSWPAKNRTHVSKNAATYQKD